MQEGPPRGRARGTAWEKRKQQREGGAAGHDGGAGGTCLLLAVPWAPSPKGPRGFQNPP